MLPVLKMGARSVLLFGFEDNVSIEVKEGTGEVLQVVVVGAILMEKGVASPNPPLLI